MKSRTFILNDTITARRIKKLIEDMETCEEKDINLYLASDGGSSGMANVFIDFTHKTDKNIHLIGMESMMSACVHIFLEVKGFKSIYPHTTAMIHLVSVDPESRELLDKKSFASVQMAGLRAENEERMRLYNNVFDLTKRERSVLRNGGDLSIDHERLRRALPKINNRKS